jgi:hypothetical protein
LAFIVITTHCAPSHVVIGQNLLQATLVPANACF